MTTKPDINLIFDPTEWELAPLEISRIEKFYPNQLAYHESSSTLALIVTRSFSGEDFALSEAGQLFIEATLEKGQRKDGKAVKAVWVVLADNGKAISYATAQTIRSQLGQARPGRYGQFWWITLVMTGNFPNETW